MLTLLCVEFRVVSVEYFLDRMQWYEAQALIDAIPMADRNQWEQTRMKVYATASMFSKKQLKPTDILQFPWEGKAPTENDELTAEQLNEIQENIKRIQQRDYGKQ